MVLAGEADAMIYSHTSFRRLGLDDDEATIAANINGIAGSRCAAWLAQSLAPMLPEAVFELEPIPEDWGWAIRAEVDRDWFVLGCSDDKERGDGRWWVLLGDDFNRGLLPATKRRRAAALELMSAALERFLQDQTDVSELKITRER